MDFHIFAILWKIQIVAYFYVILQNSVKIGWSAAELLYKFYLQNGGRPPSWIWYDVIADHRRLVFDGPNILLKLHVDRFNILQDIAIYYIGSLIGLKLPIHAHFGEFGRYDGVPFGIGHRRKGSKN